MYVFGDNCMRAYTRFFGPIVIFELILSRGTFSPSVKAFICKNLSINEDTMELIASSRNMYVFGGNCTHMHSVALP